MSAVPERSLSVIVVDEIIGALHRLGFPLPALASMQETRVKLSEISWNVRSTATGFSISLY